MSEEMDGDQQRLFSKAELTVTYDLPPEPLTDTGSNPVWTDNPRGSPKTGHRGSLQNWP